MMKIAISIMLFFSIFDYYRLNLIKEEMTTEKNKEKEISNNGKSFTNNNDLINIEVEYCSSWGFKNYYEEMQTAFLSNFTNVRIKGRIYSVSQPKQIAIYFVYMIQIIVMILIFVPDYVKSLDILPINIFDFLEAKKWPATIGVFLIGNFITGILGNSGAFEVIINGKLAFSKLNLGRVPNMDELINLIRKMDLQLLN